jgi:hypothetical protein
MPRAPPDAIFFRATLRQRHVRLPAGTHGPSFGEAEEMSLLTPFMRQVLAQPKEPRRRQLDWLTATLSDSEVFGHCLDAGVRSSRVSVGHADGSE